MKLCRELSDLVVYTNSVAAQDIVDDGKAQESLIRPNTHDFSLSLLVNVVTDQIVPTHVCDCMDSHLPGK